MNLALWLLLLAVNPPSRDELASFVAGVEKTPDAVNGQPLARVGREAGEVISLRLDGMTLAPDDFRLLGRIATLRTVSLRRTNVTDKDFAHLRGLAKLQYVVLSDTEVTDRAIDALISLPALRTCCLGNVKITPAGIEKLKEQFPRLSLGYSQRKN